MDVSVKDNGNGTYSCSYLPKKPVKHTAMVSWGGVNIPNSPFRVSIAIVRREVSSGKYWVLFVLFPPQIPQTANCKGFCLITLQVVMTMCSVGLLLEPNL